MQEYREADSGVMKKSDNFITFCPELARTQFLVPSRLKDDQEDGMDAEGQVRGWAQEDGRLVPRERGLVEAAHLRQNGLCPKIRGG